MIKFYDFNLNGELVQVCQLERKDRELYVYNRFMRRAESIAKYYAKKHDELFESESSCALWCCSVMYEKFLDLRSRAIKKAGVDYNAVDVLSMIKTLSQLKIAFNRCNFQAGGEYIEHQAFSLPSFDILVNANNGKKIHFPQLNVNASSELIGKTDNRLIGKCFDYIDVLKMWENRHERHEAKLEQALKSLDSMTSVFEYTTDKHFLTMTEAERERAKKAMNSELHKIARYNSQLSRMTELNGSYGTPESLYFESLDNLRVMRKVSAMSNYKHFEDIKALLVNADSVMTSAERVALTRFRKAYNIGADVTRADLKYLLQL